MASRSSSQYPFIVVSQSHDDAFPRDVWYVHTAIVVENGIRRLKGNPFRAFVHPVDRMNRLIESAGFHLGARRQTWQWSADVWVR